MPKQRSVAPSAPLSATNRNQVQVQQLSTTIASAAQDVWSHLICTAISEEHPYKRVSNGSNEDTPTRSQWVKEL